MATAAQIHANRANAEKSTGPKTEAGKAASSKNRLSHGFASNARFIEGEDPKEFYALLDDLIAEFRPSTASQQILVEKMAHNRWIGLRASRLQGELLNTSLYLTQLPLFIRYQASADREFHRAYQDLLKSQKQTPKSEIGFESKKAPEPTVAPPVVMPKSAPKPATKPPFTPIQEEIASPMAAGGH